MNQRQLAPGRPTRGALFASLAVSVALCVGCGDDPKPPSKTADQAANTAPPLPPTNAQAKPDTASPTSGSIHIDDKIVKACGDLPTAHFAFDSTAIGPDATVALDALARCFVTGPLKGRSMRLVGHADPRGETDYNLALGQKRAGSVADFLNKKGLDKAHVETLSKGALEATGTDEQGWARDRKVEVVLVD